MSLLRGRIIVKSHRRLTHAVGKSQLELLPDSTYSHVQHTWPKLTLVCCGHGDVITSYNGISIPPQIPPIQMVQGSLIP